MGENQSAQLNVLKNICVLVLLQSNPTKVSANQLLLNMCIVVFALRQHEQFPFILIANRDEYYSRPANPAQFWSDCPDLLGGRDQQAGGSWLGVNRYGRIAAVTNYFDPSSTAVSEASRGRIVIRFLQNTQSAEEYTALLDQEHSLYNGYGALYGTATQIHYHTNRANLHTKITSGIHGLSNHLLDTPWPKLTEAKSQLRQIIKHRGTFHQEALFDLLSNSNQNSELNADIQDSHSGSRLPIFVRLENYGTRCSTVVLISNTGTVFFEERTFLPSSKKFISRCAFEFQLAEKPGLSV